MKICTNDFLYAISDALDCVEAQLLGATNYHSKRVAYISSGIGREFNLTDKERLILTSAAVLHDNALTEYISEEHEAGNDVLSGKAPVKLGDHCIKGEENIIKMPFYKGYEETILYHHEEANGKGPFGKLWGEVPLFARIIHLADVIDVTFDLSDVNEGKYSTLIKFVRNNSGVLFDKEVSTAFKKSFNLDALKKLNSKNINQTLRGSLPIVEQEYSPNEIIDMSSTFAKIVDYKSHFTCTHSQGIAEKAKKMGEYYGYDQEMNAKLYLAGALHDIGKLLVDSDILEKPGALTGKEYAEIQNHAMGTYKVLSQIKGMDDITSWSSHHHEKLDGSGYPFGKGGKDLGKNERLMACLDIYQALVETRPYKSGMSHREAMGILRTLAEKGMLDGNIVIDIDKHFS